MKLLLDTYVFLWWIDDDPRLSKHAAELIGDGTNEVFFSAASGWELVIKNALGRIEFPSPPQRFIPGQLEQNGVQVLPIHLAHALKVAELPALHKDPFDRMLIAQALVEEVALVTSDDEIRRYPVSLVW